MMMDMDEQLDHVNGEISLGRFPLFEKHRVDAISVFSVCFSDILCSRVVVICDLRILRYLVIFVIRTGSQSGYASSSSPTDIIGASGSSFQGPSANSVSSPSSQGAMQTYFPAQAGSPTMPSGATAQGPHIIPSNGHEGHAMPMQSGRAYPSQGAGESSLQHGHGMMSGLHGNIGEVDGWNTSPPGGSSHSHGHGGHVLTIPGNSPYDPTANSLAHQQQQHPHWNTQTTYQSPSEADYFKILFKELNMPRGFDSIYTAGNSDAMMEGLGPVSRHPRRPHPGLPHPQAGVAGSMGPMGPMDVNGVNGAYYGAPHAQQTPSPPQQQPYAPHQASVQNGYMPVGLMR